MPGKTDKRHLARKIALGTLYCSSESKEIPIETCQTLAEETLEITQTQEKKEEYDQELAKELIQKTPENKEKINPIIKECAPQWPLEKIFKIDLIILQIAIYELLIKQNTPDKVVLDEAVELAKEYGNDTSSSFVNGVLGTVFERKDKYVS
ncbi:transcription antitermination factor NusB [candidate division WWE3 bacterium]|nr:transcription antitermination factor NusB [candidate division WWE3 bacterium]